MGHLIEKCLLSALAVIMILGMVMSFHCLAHLGPISNEVGKNIYCESSSVCKFPPLRGSPSAPSLMFIADLISQVLAQSSSSGGPS